MRARVVVVIVLALVGCGGGEEAPSGGRGRGPFGAPAASAAPATVIAHGTSHHPFDTLDHDSLSPTARAATTAAATTTGGGGGGAAATEPEGRHLDRELAAAIGSPASCLDLETARSLHGHLSVSVSATVMPTGNITRATASGGSLPPAVLTCLQTRALGAHLAAPVDGAPRTVSTSISFDVETTADTTTTTTPVWHQPGAVQEPGTVLPAIGAEGRPSGALAPDSTLPAVGAQGRPEGSVGPDIVTPARGGGGTIWPSNP